MDFNGFQAICLDFKLPQPRLELFLSDEADLRLWTLRLHREGLGSSRLAAELARWDVAYVPRRK